MKLILSLLFSQLHCHPLSPSSLLSDPTGYTYLTVGACDARMEELIDTYPIPNSDTALVTCQTVCGIIESCNFFKYNEEDGKCFLFRHRFLEICQLVGGQAHPDITQLLQEPDHDSACDSFVGENCTYTGSVVFTKIWPEEAIMNHVECQKLLSQIGDVFKAEYFVYDSDKHSCVWYDSPEAHCDGISGPVQPQIQHCNDINTKAPVCDAMASKEPKCLCGDENALYLKCNEGETCDKADPTAPKCIPPVCAASASSVPKCICGDPKIISLYCEEGDTCDMADADAPKCIPPV